MNIKSYEDFCSYQYVSRETYDKLKIFEKTLIKWQSSINLIGKSTINHIWTRHFLDSAQLYPFIKDVKGDIIDFGSGAGFPGLVLAIMSNKNICLVDADKKKCSFLREVAMLSETKVTICNTRIESLSFKSVDLITSRALAPLKKLIEYVKIFVNQSSSNTKTLPNMLFLKGKSYKIELTDLEKDDSLKFKIYPSLTDKYGKILHFNNKEMLKSSYEQ